MTRIFINLALCFVMVGCASLDEAATFRGSYVRGAMGTVARIVVHAPTEAAAAQAATEGFALIDEFERVLTDYRPDSEVAELGRQAGRGPTKVSEVLGSVLELSIREARRSHGAFDPTISPLVKLWREARRSGQLPSQDSRDVARSLVNYQDIQFDPVRRTAELRRTGMALDFGGIGKGFTADRVVALMRSRGFNSAMCEIGGDFALGDAPPGTVGWRIGAGDGGPSLTLSNCGVATSGDVEQHVDIGGVRYSHIVDPKTGLGLTSRARVAVVAEDGTTADALATALSVLGPKDGFAILPAGAAARIAFGLVSPQVSTTPNYQKLSASR